MKWLCAACGPRGVLLASADMPAVVAGLVEAPVIGLPVSTGYGLGGGGEAALYSMLQSCSVLTVVNIDAGFVAGAYAAKIARRKEPLRVGEKYNVVIESIGRKGDGLAWIRGLAVFITKTRIGEKSKIRIEKVLSSYAIVQKI